MPGYRVLDRRESFSSLFDENELFEGFLSAEGRREQGLVGPGTLYFNYEVEPGVFNRQGDAAVPSAHLPKRSDGSLEGYVERIKRELHTTRYCVRLTELHAYVPAMWKRLCELLPTLGDAAKIENGRAVRTAVFAGHYDYTPVGIHVDPYPQIQCVLTGERLALFWDASYCAKLTDADRMKPLAHVDAADAIPMTKGDAVYWPAGQEHLFSSKDGFAIAMTISFPEVDAPGSELEAARRRSAHHFQNVPPTIPPRPSSKVFRGAKLFPFEVVDDSLVSAGTSFAIGLASPDLQLFANRVNDTQTTFEVSDTMNDLRIGEEDARELVQALVAHHCVEVVDQ
jgi:hypothetical protein